MVVDGLNEVRGIPIHRWPAFRIVAAARMAFDGRKLIVAAAGLIVLHLGWALLDLAFPDSAAVTPDMMPTGAGAATDGLAGMTGTIVDRLSEPARILSTPLFALLDPANRGLSMLHSLLAIAWTIVVWGFCGGAIARIAAVQEARSRQVGIGEALRFARRSCRSLILVPLYPLLALAICSLTGLCVGLLYRIPGGPAVAGVLLFIPLLVGLVMTLLVAALVAGWPMFHAALATGADDSLDALSRTYSYLNQRLVLFVAGVALASIAGVLGLTLVDWLAAGVIRLTRWSLSLSGPPSLIAALFDRVSASDGAFDSAAHVFWLRAVDLLARAWIYAYFWSSATLLYLWLRHEVDGTPATSIDPPGCELRPE